MTIKYRFDEIEYEICLSFASRDYLSIFLIWPDSEYLKDAYSCAILILLIALD